MRYQTSRASARVPSAIFRRNARVARRAGHRVRPAGTPQASTRNLTLGVVTVRSARGHRRRFLVPLGANMSAFRCKQRHRGREKDILARADPTMSQSKARVAHAATG